MLVELLAGLVIDASCVTPDAWRSQSKEKVSTAQFTEVVFAEGCACFYDDVGSEIFMVDILKVLLIVRVALLNSAAHISYRVTIDYQKRRICHKRLSNIGCLTMNNLIQIV